MAICVGGSAALGSGSFADLASALGCGQRYLRLAAGGGAIMVPASCQRYHAAALGTSRASAPRALLQGPVKICLILRYAKMLICRLTGR